MRLFGLLMVVRRLMPFAVQALLAASVLGAVVSLLFHCALRKYVTACCVSVAVSCALIMTTIPFTHFGHGDKLTWIAFAELGTFAIVRLVPSMGMTAASSPLLAQHVGMAICLVFLVVVAAVVGLPFRYIRKRRYHLLPSILRN